MTPENPIAEEGRLRDEVNFTIGQIRGALNVVRSASEIDRARLDAVLVSWEVRLLSWLPALDSERERGEARACRACGGGGDAIIDGEYDRNGCARCNHTGYEPPCTCKPDVRCRAHGAERLPGCTCSRDASPSLGILPTVDCPYHGQPRVGRAESTEAEPRPPHRRGRELMGGKPKCHIPGCSAWQRGEVIYRISPKGEAFVGACLQHKLRPPDPNVPRVAEIFAEDNRRSREAPR